MITNIAKCKSRCFCGQTINSIYRHSFFSILNVEYLTILCVSIFHEHDWSKVFANCNNFSQFFSYEKFWKVFYYSNLYLYKIDLQHIMFAFKWKRCFLEIFRCEKFEPNCFDFSMKNKISSRSDVILDYYTIFDIPF